MNKLRNALLLAAGVIVIAGAVAWYKIPLVRYELMPITGGTAAPETLYPKGRDEGKNVPVHEAATHLLADRDGLVSDISQVPEEGGWINSPPLELKALQQKHKVVLIDFWTYTCINCIRANPFSEELWERYKDHGLVVIGVHSPEFDIEHDPANILAAAKRQGLTYPILTDADMAVWHAFGNHFWPGKYLIDTHGQIVFHQFGEGNYAGEEQAVREQLKKAGYELPDYGPPDPAMDLVPVSRPQTPELYAGPAFLREPYGNGQRPQNGVTTDYTLPDGALAEDQIFLGGAWRGDQDYVQSEGLGIVALNYQAQAAYAVLDSVGGKRTVTVTLDDKPIPPDFRGKDIRLQGDHTIMTVDAPRLYWPIANHAPYGRHTIRFSVPAGVRLYSFTFGTYR